MKIIKQVDSFNKFSIEDLSAAKVSGIIDALEYCKGNAIITCVQLNLLKALKEQKYKLNLG